MTRQIATNRPPKITRLVDATHQRSLAISRAYWAKPTKS
ncbi:hypothetical protein Q427_09885 [Halomonas sp. BC04]|nr:hypothetical protein Q427_09885 [Halomonas sp. BC04]